jgi:hypothetical protein
MSQIEIEEETVWYNTDTKINNISAILPEEYIYIILLTISLLYSIRLLKS